jgi:ABC-type transport system involved in Fe-S cluster assembly fused permease/ATPase subunit
MKLDFIIFKNNSETVQNSFNKSLQGLERLNRWVLGNVMSNTIEILIISGMMYFMLGPKYFINTVGCYVLYLFVTKKINNYRNKFIADKFKADVNAENKLFDIIYNIDTVKYFQREVSESDKYSNIIKGVREKDQKVISSLSLINTIQSLIISIGMVANLMMGVHDCYHGILTPGDLVMLQAIFTQMMMPLGFMGTLMREVEETRVNLQYAIDMINNRKKMTNEEKKLQQFHFQGGNIEFKDVSFGYPNPMDAAAPPKLILNNCNATFEKGSVNAIIGVSGQGKSTIFNLIYKLYEPIKGKILIDGQDLNQLETDSYRRVIFHYFYYYSIWQFVHKMDTCLMSLFFIIFFMEIMGLLLRMLKQY